jgi:hypothetical protein
LAEVAADAEDVDAEDVVAEHVDAIHDPFDVTAIVRSATEQCIRASSDVEEHSGNPITPYTPDDDTEDDEAVHQTRGIKRPAATSGRMDFAGKRRCAPTTCVYGSKKQKNTFCFSYLTFNRLCGVRLLLFDVR